MFSYQIDSFSLISFLTADIRKNIPFENLRCDYGLSQWFNTNIQSENEEIKQSNRTVNSLTVKPEHFHINIMTMAPPSGRLNKDTVLQVENTSVFAC